MGEAATAMDTTTMPTAALPRGAAAPVRPQDAGAVRPRGITVTEAPTAPEEVPLHGAAAPEAPQDSEAELLRGVTAPAPITGPSAVQAPGVVDSFGGGDVSAFSIWPLTLPGIAPRCHLQSRRGMA